MKQLSILIAALALQACQPSEQQLETNEQRQSTQYNMSSSAGRYIGVLEFTPVGNPDYFCVMQYIEGGLFCMPKKVTQ